MSLFPIDRGAKCLNLSLRMELHPLCVDGCSCSWCHFWLEMGAVVLERKASLEKEFPTGSSQRKLIVFMPINCNWGYKGRESFSCSEAHSFA